MPVLKTYYVSAEIRFTVACADDETAKRWAISAMAAAEVGLDSKLFAEAKGSTLVCVTEEPSGRKVFP